MRSATLRRFKYTFGADVIRALVRFTPFLDGNARPPNAINFAGAGDFEAGGNKTVALMQKHAGLKENDDVLDIGSAIGRNALALHRVMGDDISYEGFDIVAYGVEWSRKTFAKLSGQYNFSHANIWNSFYNPRGRLKPAEFTFPYTDGRFDISVATSVYTHMRKDAVAQYLTQTARVTKRGGRAYFTVFGHDGVNEKSKFSFTHKGDGDWIEDLSEPAMAVAYDLDWVREYLTALGAVKVDVHTGYWRGTKGLDFQDIVVAHF
ncbi:MAG: class I SAM-dependent methyltransferase [Litorimonas sp.]